MGFRIFWLLLMVSAGGLASEWAGEGFYPERRRSQVQKEPGYIASPVAVNIPGVGFSYGVVGSYFNAWDTEMDLFGFTASGDSSGFGLGLIDTPIWRDSISLNTFVSRFESTGFESHRRGVGSDPDDARVLKLGQTDVLVNQLSLRLWDKRLQLYAGLIYRASKLDAILTKQGDEIARPRNGKQLSQSKSIGALLDLTDDRADPRDGLQFETQWFFPQMSDAFSAEYYLLDYNFLYYVPVGALDTLVINAYRSDAIVVRKGERDEARIRERVGLRCDAVPQAGRGACRQEEAELIAETRAANTYGTASGIGGTQRMRSYVTGRFKAAHAQTFGLEYRWNLTEEFTPFNIYLAKGIRTGIQLAAFAEWGTVSDQEAPLGAPDTYKPSYGLGLRALVASGFIVRLDLAKGDEGIQPTLFFNYPWFVF